MPRELWLLVLGLVAGTATSSYGSVLYATDFGELSNAISTANADPGSTIYLAPGVYSGGALPNILADLTLALDPSYGQPAGSAILDTTPTGKKGLLTIPFPLSSVDLTVDGLTFRNASISANDGGNAAGIRDQ